MLKLCNTSLLNFLWLAVEGRNQADILAESWVVFALLLSHGRWRHTGQLGHASDQVGVESAEFAKGAAKKFRMQRLMTLVS